VLIAAGLALVSAVGFVHRERTAASPLIPPAYFRRRNFTLPMGTRSFAFFAYFGGFFLFPLMMEQVYHYSETQVGLLSIARPLMFSLSSPVAGYLTVRIGERTSAMAGAAFVTLSMVLFARLGADPSLVVVVAALCLSGLGMGVAGPATSSSQANEVDPSQFGVMSAAQQLATQVGEVAGIQILITVQETAAARAGPAAVHGGLALLPSFQRAFWVGAAVAFAGLVCATFIKSMDRSAASPLIAPA
jgi:DHA2 family methylenomycin A resistance protein-like MFS transporter